MKKVAIIVAGGSGNRLGCSVPKAFVKLAGLPMFEYSIVLFERLGMEGIIVAVPEGFKLEAERVLAGGNSKARVVCGGATRTESVRAAFEAVAPEIDIVGIHDAARPLLEIEDAAAVFEAAAIHGASALAITVVDTLKSSKDGFIETTIPREGLFAVQTPQVFRRNILERALRLEGDFTDDCAMVEALGEKVYIVEGHRSNFKITYPEDLILAETILKARSK